MWISLENFADRFIREPCHQRSDKRMIAVRQMSGDRIEQAATSPFWTAALSAEQTLETRRLVHLQRRSDLSP